MRSVSEKKRKQLSASGERLAHNSTLRAPSAPIRKKPRKPSETLRIYGTPERREWIKSLPCHIGKEWPAEIVGACDGPIQNCHSVSGGKGRKADANTIFPGCRLHHQCYDQYVGIFADRDIRASIIGAALAYDLSWTTRTT